MKKVYRVVKFNQKAWLKPDIDMNIELRKNVKKWWVFAKTMKNVRNHRDTKLIITEAKMNYSVSEPSYHTAKNFSNNLLAIEIK